MDYNRGSDISSCGNLTTPCKTLSVAVERVSAAGGTVVIHGNQTLEVPVVVTKRLKIKGANGTTITQKKPGSELYAFEISISD